MTDPEKLRTLADWLDSRYPFDDEVQQDLRRIADELSTRASQSAVPSDEEMRWRKLLWWNHGCRPTHYLYGDDGELQCNLCGVDFKRATLDEIERGIAG